MKRTALILPILALALRSLGVPLQLHFTCTRADSSAEKLIPLNGYGIPHQDTVVFKGSDTTNTVFITALAYGAEEPHQTIVYLRLERQRLPLELDEIDTQSTNIIAFMELHVTNQEPTEVAIRTTAESNLWGNAVIMLEKVMSSGEPKPESQQAVAPYR